MTRNLYFTIETTNPVEIENLFSAFYLTGIVNNVPDSVTDEEVAQRIGVDYDGTKVELVTEIYEDPEFIIDWELIDKTDSSTENE